MIGARTKVQTELSGRVGLRRGLFWRKVVTVEERHEVLSGWLPALSCGTPSRSPGDVWTTWRDARPDDLLRMGEQLRAAHGNNT